MAVERGLEKLISSFILSRLFQLFGWLRSLGKFYILLPYCYWDVSLYCVLCTFYSIDLIKFYCLL